jgi:hypothetical protein
MSAPSWEEFLGEHFPGYLLPSSSAHAISVDAASRFLERITGRPDQLTLLRAVSTLAPRMAAVHELATVQLPDLVRRLPARTVTKLREWEGGFQGRLDVRGTLAHHLAGRSTRFVTRARERRFDLPETVLVRGVCERLLALLERLRKADVISSSGWGAVAHACEGALRHALAATVLRDVETEALTSFHEAAARAGRHPCYPLALGLHVGLRAGLDSDDEAAIARVVAEGALAPLDAPTRFEIAVVVRLLVALQSHLDDVAPGRWTMHRTLVTRGRREVADLERDDGVHVRVFYNQAILPSGPADRGGTHYLGQTGRMRPDVTVVVEQPGHAPRAVVIEVKLSDDPKYVLSGLHEAHLYRAEYAPYLTGWPKAILVASSPVVGAPRAEDDVVAVGWDRWVPPEVLVGVLAAAALDSPSSRANTALR